MQKDESPLPPPIPPRRKRCKTQPKRPTITYTLETKPERKHRPAPPLPPPTAPQRNRGRRKTPSPFNENSSPTNAKSLDSLEYGPNSLEESTRHSFVNLETEKSNRSRSTSPFPKAPEINKYPPLYFTFQDYQMVMEGSVRSKDELFKEKNITFIEENQNVFIEEQKSNFTLGQKEKFDEENDKYSKDQQQEYNEEQEDKFFKEQQSAFVEEEKHNGVEEEENDDESIEQTLKMNTESNAFPVRENLTSATENEELYFHISSANEPHMSKEEFESPFAPFMENISFSNAREEIYFRVTTTDRPFEKCLGDWNRSFDNEPKEFKDESESNLYMFEDYMDRSNRLNARPRLLFSEDFFSIPQDENSVSTERSTTRVRFLIESPSTSTPDYDLNDDGTTYEEFIQRQFESYEKSSVQLTEVTDEELEDLDKNLNNTYENETENNEVSNFESETAEDENMSESIYGLTADQINDYSYSDWEEEIENVETHSITACIENESNTDIKTEENVELSQLQEIIDNNIEIKNEDCTIEESCEVELIINKSEEACDIEVKNEDTVIEKLHKKELIIDENEGACYVEIKNENIIVEELQEKESIIDKSEKTYERRKVFLDSSFYNLSNENDMWQSCDDNRDDTLPDECCQPNLPEVSEPTKYFEESIGIEEQNEINVERDSKHIENLKEEIICTTIPEIESTVEKKPVPESVRRNSFLETMLRDNFSQDSWDTGSINCEVIATHPKQDLSALSEQQSTRPLDVVTEVATETEAAPRNNSKIKLTESGSQPKVQSRINVSSSNNKSAGDVKCDVLNELLTTFSAIKLKPVNTSTCESVRSKDPNEQKTDITMPVEVKTDKSYQFRKTQNTLEIKNDDNLKKEENFNSSIINSNLNVLTTDENLNLPKVDPNLNSLKVEESSIASINKDTSAIINEASNTQRNDNDNKAQTPVVVNKDQFREAVSIIPGSVRNFVKYYEIHSEISSISKIRDNAFKKQKCELVRDKEKSKAYKKSGEKNKKIFKNSTSPKTGITTNANIIDESSRKIPSPLNSPNEIKKKSSMKTIAPSPRPERKKSVQFDSDCTVINPRKKEDKEKEEEGTFSSFIGGIRTRLKKKAPIKPDVKKTEQPKGLKLDQCRTESTAIICIQKSPEAKAMACTTKPGEDAILGVISPTTAGRRDAWKSLNGSATSCRNQQQRQQQQEGSSLAKRPRHPAPPPPPPRLSSANKENRPEQQQQQQKQQQPQQQQQQNDNAVSVVVAYNQSADSQIDMGSNLSRHSGKGLNGRRAQSSGNLCDSKGISVGKILVPCSRTSREKYKFCGSLPNHLDGKDTLDDDTSENNNVITDTISGNLGGTLPHKKRHVSTHFSDEPTNNLDLVKHRSEESLEGDPWKYRQDIDLVKCRHLESVRKSRGSDAGSTSSCPHHHHHHHEWRRNSSTLSRGRAHRSAELDVVGTLPKRRQDSTKRSAPSLGELGTGPTRASRISIDQIDDDLLLKMVHKPDCELLKHRKQNQQSNAQQPTQQQGDQQQQHQSKCVDLKLHKLSTSGEPQDQGYASERSPEDEHPPSLPGQPFPSITPESTFRVTLQKSSRGLGLSVSGGGTSGPVRVKRLFPQQPAALSNKLQPGDILLAANGIPLTGLTNYEALEVLRTTASTVELVVCRLPGDTSGSTPPATAPPPPPTRKDNPGLTLKIPLNPLPPLEVEPCGEFDIEMTKVAGSLGFTLRKADSSALGHYVRALVREPALSDGRIQPGDKIIAVDDAPLSPLSHEEAVSLLRQCGPTVKLRLYRDPAQTPVSALSPTEFQLRPTKTCLRQEAVDMLCDLAVRKLSPGTSSGSSCPRQSSGTSCHSPRRLRRPATRSSTADTDEAGSSSASRNNNNRHSHASTLSQETSDSDQCSIKTQITNSQPDTPANDIIEPPALYLVCDSSDNSSAVVHKSTSHHHHHHHQQQQQQQQQQRPSFLDLQANHEKPRFQFSIDSDCSDCAVPVIVTDSDNSTNIEYQGRSGLSSDEQDTNLPNEPASMPPLLSSTSSTSTAFSYKNPAYQSANPACGLTSQQHHATGVNVENSDVKNKHSHSSEHDIPGKIMGADDPGGSKGLLKWKGVMFAPSDNDVTDGKCKIHEDRDARESAALSSLHEQGHEVFMVELTRGWNSRLGFSLQPDGENTVISVVHPDSVAAKDGRLKQGDVLIMVNDESVEHMSTADIIDLLRKIRGSIGITVLRRKKEDAT